MRKTSVMRAMARLRFAPRFSGRFRAVLQLHQRAPADIGQLAERGLAVARGLHELLCDELAALVIAAMRESRQISSSTTSILANMRSSKSFTMQPPIRDIGPPGAPLPHCHFFPIIGTKLSVSGFRLKGTQGIEEEG